MSSARDPAGPDRPGTGDPDEPLVTPLGDSGPGDETTPARVAPSGHEPAGDPGAGFASASPDQRRSGTQSANMLPPRERRRFGLERILVRLIATAGIVGIGVAIGAIMVSNNSKGWIVGLVVSAVTVVLAAILWSSRQL